MKFNNSFLIAMITLVSWPLVNCAKQPKRELPPIGKTFEVKPYAKDFNSKSLQLVTNKKKQKITLLWGGRTPIEKDQLILNFYKAMGDDTPLYSISWKDLEQAHESEKCTNEDIELLDGYLSGTALICDQRIDFSKVAYIEGENSKGKIRSATSWTLHPINQSVDSISIGLY